MHFGVHLVARVGSADNHNAVAGFADLVRVADRSGFTRISTGDVQGNHLECVSALTLMATLTERVEVGPQVTHPVTREPGVLAAALASLQAISDGRAYAILGRGDGAARNAGLRPAKVAETANYLHAVQTLLATGQTCYRGRTLCLPWPNREARHLPLLLAAEGPRMLALAGEVADGVLIGTGLTPEVIDDSLRHIEIGAARANRDPHELELWWTARCAIAPTTAEALAHAKENLSSAGNHALKGDYASKLVPISMHDALREYHSRYSYADKNPATGVSRNGELMDQLGLTDYFAHRFGVLGSSETVVRRIHELKRWGVRALTVSANEVHELVTFRDEIFPRFGLAVTNSRLEGSGEDTL